MIIQLFIKPVNKFSELKVGFSPSWKISRKICVICLIESLLKMMNKCFLFHLKSSFHSQDIYVFVTTFWSCRKSSLSREITLGSWRRSLVYKRVKCAYCPTSRGVGVARRWNLVNWENIASETLSWYFLIS